MYKEMRLRLHGKTVAILSTQAVVFYVYHEHIPDGLEHKLYDYLQFSVAPEDYNGMVKHVY